MPTAIRVKSLGEDGFNRETYKNVLNGRVYALVDGRYHTTTKDGEPEAPLKREIVVLLSEIKEKYSIGELLANYLCNSIRLMTVESEEQAKEFVKSAKFHGVKAYYVYKDTVPKIHMVVDDFSLERFKLKEGFVCPSLNG